MSLVFIHYITHYHSVVFYNDIEENGEYKHVQRGLAILTGKNENKATQGAGVLTSAGGPWEE